MNLVDTRDINLLGDHRMNFVPNLVPKMAVCAKLCAKLVKSKLSENTKKLISFNELHTCPLGGIW